MENLLASKKGYIQRNTQNQCVLDTKDLFDIFWSIQAITGTVVGCLRYLVEWLKELETDDANEIIRFRKGCTDFLNISKNFSFVFELCRNDLKVLVAIFVKDFHK